MRVFSRVSGRTAFVATMVLAVAASPVFAGKITVSTASTAVISDGAGSSRVLIRPGDLSAIRGRLVTSAYLTFTLPGQAAERDIPVRVYPLTSDWNAGSVTWESPWTASGGDVEGTYYETRVVKAGARPMELRLDVSPMVRAMAQGEIGEYGFVVTVPGYDGAGFRSADLSTLGTLTAAVLEIDYRSTTRVPVMSASAQPAGPATGRPTDERGSRKPKPAEADTESADRPR
jgi:hypothetical protein